MSSGAVFRSRHQAGRETVAEHHKLDRGVCSLSSPFGFTLGVHRFVFFPAYPPPKLRHLFVRQAKDFSPYSAAVGGVSRFILQSRYQ